MSIKGTVIAGVVKLKMRRKMNRLYRDLEDPERSVEEGLRSILEFGKDSEYGRRYDFAHILEADSAEELYRRYSKLPIITYPDIKEYVDKSTHGAPDVLFKGRPLMYMITSGTTSEPKLLPVSEYYVQMINDMMNMMFVRQIKLAGNFFEGKIFGITGKAKEYQTPDGTWVGSVSGYNRETSSRIVKSTLAVPGEIFDVSDYNARYYLLMRFAIEQDVRHILTANPTTVIELLENAKLNFDKYCDDIASGSINKELNIPGNIREILERKIKPNPGRAAELRALKAVNDPPLPKDYWPNMNVLCTWKCANTAFFIDGFKEVFPEKTKHMEFGYYASECRFGVPFDESNYSTVFPQEYYVEFIEEEEYGKPDAKTYRIYELTEGKKYCVIVSTKAGLYRYDMADIVVAGPRIKNTPTIQLLQKTSGIVSMTGEKVSEQQFNEAVKKASEMTGHKVSFYMGFANLEKLYYDVYAEFTEGDIPETDRQKFAEEADKQLYEMNVEYAAKRDSFRLNMPVVHSLPKNAFIEYKKALLESKKSKDNQFKIMTINQNDDLKSVIDSLALN